MNRSLRSLPVTVLCLCACTATPPAAPGGLPTDSDTVTTDGVDSAQPSTTDAERAADVARLPDAAGPLPCKGAGDCPLEAPLCLAGACAAKTTCTSDKQCAPLGLVCDKAAGSCVVCLGDVDCPADHACKANTCVPPAKPCKSSKECPAGQVCHPSQLLCVDCAGPGDCEPGQVCIDSVCAAAACKPGAAKCADTGNLLTCKGDGSGWDTKACGSDAVCVADACKPLVCEAKLAFCAGNVAMVCSADGTTSSLVADCAATGQLCLAGACTAKACQAGTALCADTKSVAQCKADGSGYDKTPCPADKGCANGSCVAKVCTPGQDVCSGNLVQHCNPSGTALVQTADCAAQGKVCANGTCATSTPCVPGTKSCAGQTWKLCKADGSGWTETACDDGNPCTSDGCDAQLGCSKTPLADGVACGIGQACKGGVCGPGVVCGAGIKKCEAAKLVTCKADGSGWTEQLCNDGNPCTADGCSDTAGCNVVAFPDGTACGAGSVCNAGVCGAPNACGNGKLDVGEECDDGNTKPCDGCEACKLRSALKLSKGGA